MVAYAYAIRQVGTRDIHFLILLRSAYFLDLTQKASRYICRLYKAQWAVLTFELLFTSPCIWIPFSSSSSLPMKAKVIENVHVLSLLAITGTVHSPSSSTFYSHAAFFLSRLKKIKCLQSSPETSCEACKAAKIPCKFRDRERYFAERSRAIAGPSSASLHPQPPSRATSIVPESSERSDSSAGSEYATPASTPYAPPPQGYVNSTSSRSSSYSPPGTTSTDHARYQPYLEHSRPPTTHRYIHASQIPAFIDIAMEDISLHLMITFVDMQLLLQVKHWAVLPHQAVTGQVRSSTRCTLKCHIAVGCHISSRFSSVSLAANARS